LAEIVNLNKLRKVKARAADESLAQANRIKYGRTKAERENDRRAADRSALLHQGKKLDEE
jgi:hypothetical protein